MRSILKDSRHPARRYAVVGISVYILELLLIVFAQKLGASPVWAVAISFCLGTLVSFFLQKLITFGDKRMHRRVLLPQAVAVTALLLWNLGFSLLLTKALQNYLPAIASRTFALGVTTVWNFYLYKTRIFKKSTEVFIS